ncbi:MAG: DNA recombination protein RmuC [Patescibacteria group bacterium]
MDLLSLAIIIVVLIAGFGALIFVLKKTLTPQNQEQNLEAMVNKVFGLTANQLAQQSKQLLSAEKEVIQTDLMNKERSIQKMVEQIKTEIDERQKEIRALEQDRNKSYASIKESIEQHREITKELKTTTDSLAKVLSNNQQRGEWGERIIEDLLQSSGFVEGVHYVRQAKLGAGSDRPDITLMLPNKRVVPVDVKFPYSEMQKMVTTDSKQQKEIHEKQFAIDVKQKIKKVALYIRPEDDTLDYAILFVPNEMVFSFINQKYPELISEAIRMRVMIVSPFTFLIVARTIMESYRNFMMESNLRSIVKQIGEFAKEWEMFIDEFDTFGKNIGKLDESYHKIRDTRHKQMSRKIEHIEKFKHGDEKASLNQ